MTDSIAKSLVNRVIEDDAMLILCSELTPTAHRQVKAYLKQSLNL